MTLPENFSPFEHLQSVLTRVHNKRVRDAFREDVLDDDINTPESSLKHACMIVDNDTATMMLLRMYLFDFLRGDLIHNIGDSIIGIPSSEFGEKVAYKPQVILSFRESMKDAKSHQRYKHPKRMRISFRLMIEEDQITQTLINRIKADIKTLLPSSFSFRTGLHDMSYRDPSHGFKLLIPFASEWECFDLIQKVCNIANAPFNKTLCRSHDYVSPPEKKTVHILGDTYQVPTRTVGVVRLSNASLAVRSMNKKISLMPLREF